MSDNVSNFLIKLGEDQTVAAEFKNNPHEAMSKAGLEQHEKDAIMSKDPARIRQLVKPVGDTPIVVVVVIV